MGKLFQEHKRKERAGAQPHLGSWAQTSAPTSNHHTKLGHFLKTGARRPAVLSSSSKGTEIYINQLLIRQQGQFSGSRSPFLCQERIWNWRYWQRMRGRKKDLLNLTCSPKQSNRGGEATLLVDLNMQILDVLKNSISWFIQISSILQYPEKYRAHFST